MKNSKPILVIIQGGGCRQIECATGILKALDAADIVVDEYMGASAGAIVSCLHASGLSGSNIAYLISKTPVSDLFSFSHLQAFKMLIPFVKVSNIYNTDGLYEFLDDNIDSKASHKVLVSITRLRDYFSELVTGWALSALASSAIPEVFPPVKIGSELYVDGGVVNNIPMPKISNIKNYEHIYILLCNNDTKTSKKSWTKIGRSLKAVNETTEREAHQVFEEGWNELDNVTVIKPSPFRSHLLEWTEKNALINHAYSFTKELLTISNKIKKEE